MTAFFARARFCATLLLALAAGHSLLVPVRAQDAANPTTRETRTMAGWTVRVDSRLLNAPKVEIGRRALTLLEARLTDIATVVAPDRLEKLRGVTIVLDLDHGKLTSMQYHPSANWLRENGYAPDLAKCVHIPSAERFLDSRHQFIQPWCVLHELAHAFHDQILNFDEPRIKVAWEHYMASGRGQSVLYRGGERKQHYAMVNQKEFFAEMTEAYFGMNDFFPFTHPELKETEPETYALLAEIWGRVP